MARGAGHASTRTPGAFAAPATGVLAAAVLAVAVLAVAGCTIRGIRGAASTTVPTTTTVATTTTTTVVSTSTTVSVTATALPYLVPKVGECRGPVTAEVLAADTDRRQPSSCDQPHGNETVAVLQLPRGLTEYPGGDGLPEGVRATVKAQCQQALDAYVGAAPRGTTGRVASRLTSVWYLPSGSEWELGARWVRCDAAVIPIGPLTASYPGTFKDALTQGQVPFALTRCFDHTLELTRCDAAHAFEGTVEVRLPDGAEPPDAAVTDQLRFDQCDPLTAAAIGVGGMDEQPRLRTILLVPGAADWSTAEHVGLCIVGAVGGGDLNDSVRGIGSQPPPLGAS